MTMIRMIGLGAVSLVFSIAAEAAPPVKFGVQVDLTGNGTVSSSPGGISCPTTCLAYFKQAANIALTATPAAGETFIGWGGACSGTGSCSIPSIQADVQVSAQFSSNGGGGGGGGTTIQQLEARIAELEALVATLSSSLNGFEEQFAGVSRGTDPQTNQDTLYFDDMNVAIRNGRGGTDAGTNGRGNLIVGYNETNPFSEIPNLRSGSHNLIIGKHHSYSGFGGVVAGYASTVTGEWASVLGGIDNSATGAHSVVGGGGLNNSGGKGTFVAGGYENEAIGDWAVVSGGISNSASGAQSSISGGVHNSATGEKSVVGGGGLNNSGGMGTFVAGGYENEALGDWAVVSAGRRNIALGSQSSIAGGLDNSTPGIHSAVSGGMQNIASGFLETVVGGDAVICDDQNPGYEAQACGEGVLTEWSVD